MSSLSESIVETVYVFCNWFSTQQFLFLLENFALDTCNYSACNLISLSKMLCTTDCFPTSNFQKRKGCVFTIRQSCHRLLFVLIVGFLCLWCFEFFGCFLFCLFQLCVTDISSWFLYDQFLNLAFRFLSFCLSTFCNPVSQLSLWFLSCLIQSCFIALLFQRDSISPTSTQPFFLPASQASRKSPPPLSPASSPAFLSICQGSVAVLSPLLSTGTCQASWVLFALPSPSTFTSSIQPSFQSGPLLLAETICAWLQ